MLEWHTFHVVLYPECKTEKKKHIIIQVEETGDENKNTSKCKEKVE